MSRYVNPSQLARPSGFSHAVIAPSGRTVYLAGQTALDAEGTIVGGGEEPDVVAQFARCLSNVLTALGAAGGRAEHLVSMRIYIVDVPEYKARAREIGAVWRQLAGTHYPATAGIGVDRLWDDDALVEIEAVAVIPELTCGGFESQDHPPTRGEAIAVAWGQWSRAAIGREAETVCPGGIVGIDGGGFVFLLAGGNVAEKVMWTRVDDCHR